MGIIKIITFQVKVELIDISFSMLQTRKLIHTKTKPIACWGCPKTILTAFFTPRVVEGIMLVITFVRSIFLRFVYVFMLAFKVINWPRRIYITTNICQSVRDGITKAANMVWIKIINKILYYLFPLK